MTLVYRRLSRFRRQAANWLCGNTLVLVYHRVGTVETDPLGLFVSPENLAGHLDVLQSLGTVIPGRKIEQHVSGSLRSGLKFVITFDDGYVDNFETALPLLRNRNVPATFFVIANGPCDRLVFWGDVLNEVLLKTETLPRQFSFQANGNVYNVNLGDDWKLSREAREGCRDWKVGREAPTARHRLMKEFRNDLILMKASDRSQFLVALTGATGCESVLDSNPSVHRDVLRVVAQDERYEIGSHSLNHPRLSRVSSCEQRDEIVLSKNRLEELIERPVDAFAYPHGGPEDYTPETVQSVRDAGYRRAFVCEPRPLDGWLDAHQIPRLKVPDWGASEFRRFLTRVLADGR